MPFQNFVRPLNFSQKVSFKVADKQEPKTTEPNEIVVGMKDSLLSLWPDAKEKIRDKYTLACVGRIDPHGRHRTFIVMVPNDREYTNDQLVEWVNVSDRFITIDNEPLTDLRQPMIVGKFCYTKPESVAPVTLALEEVHDYLWDLLSFFEDTEIRTMQ